MAFSQQFETLILVLWSVCAMTPHHDLVSIGGVKSSLRCREVEMRAGKKMATIKHRKGVVPHHVAKHVAHPPKHKTMSCSLKMAVRKSA